MQVLINSIKDATLQLPAMEATLLLVLLTLCLLFDLNRTGLIVSYLFLYRWGWMMLDAQGDRGILITYLVFGAIVAVLTIMGMLKTRR